MDWEGGLSKDAHVPAGTLTLMSVATRALARAGITTSRALYRSWPAAKALPFVGARAASLRSTTWSCCWAAAAVVVVVEEGAGMAARGVGVAGPESVLRGSVDVVLRGVGSRTLVRLGRGDEGREGGSWAGAGVWDMVFFVCYLLLVVC